MIIAIDGPAGSGKSSVARAVAKRLGFHYLDTGAMYRAIAFRAIVSGVPLFDERRVAQIAVRDRISFEHEGAAVLSTRVLIAGDDVTAAIRTARVDDAVSVVASMASVREAMVAQQREIGHAGDIVVEGRDIGSVVFPDADVKVFLTATPEERARRRAAQQAASGRLVDPTGVHEAMQRRDHLDSTREASPLAQPDDAVVVDSTGLTFEQVVDRVVSLAEKARS